MNKDSSYLVVSRNDNIHGTLAVYVIGFVLSVALTLLAYVLVVNHIFTGWGLAYAISFLAVVQFVVQLLFFLHLGNDSRPRWKLLTLIFMLVILGIVVIGSLWIMHNLNYRMIMSPKDVKTYMQDQEGI